ncbi:MAG: HAMP domain-containing protein [Puniceicoccales bacterium]|jgi:signal transduction histidine kinase|nr:HAMP domain-containing protein [Puniceicoccales bacterium]
MKDSFAFRLTLRVLILVTLTSTLILVAAGLLLHRQNVHSLELLHDTEGMELIELLEKSGTASAGEIKHLIENEADRDAFLFLVQVSDAHGTALYRTDNLGTAFIPKPPAGASRHWITSNIKSGGILVSEYKTASGLHVQIGSPLDRVHHVLSIFIRLSVLLVFASMVFGVFAGLVLSRMTLAPIRAIEHTARRIRADNLSERIPVPPGRDELAALATLLNHTFDHLETAFAQIRQFSADASHELKTPLALVRLTAEKVRSRLADGTAADSAELDALLADILEETSHMHQLIETLLFIAKAEGGVLTLQRTQHDMPSFLAEFAEDARALAEDRGAQFVLARSDPGTALIEGPALRQLLLNLMANALYVTPPSSTITLESQRTETGWRLVLTDEGPGLPEDMLSRIFERFTRHGATASPGGHGLGLAICHSIADLHQATLRAQNRTDRPGLQIVMEW